MLSGKTGIEVVVSGLGVIAPGAIGVKEFGKLLWSGRSAVTHDEEMAGCQLRCQVSGRPVLSEEALSHVFSDLERRRITSAGLRYAALAGLEAFDDSSLLAPTEEPNQRWSVVFGAGVPGIDVLGNAFKLVDAGDCKKLGSAMVEMQMPSSSASLLAARIGAGGPASCNASACATGTEALLIGVDRIRRGLSDVVLVGSCESPGAHIWGAFDALRVLTRAANDRPETASRPLSASASGFVPASGAGALILESKAHALARGARIYCEVLGGHANCGARLSGGSLTAPNPVQMRNCITAALVDSRITRQQVDVISGHLTATMGDAAEVSAWADTLQREGANFPYINAPKSIFGHALSASGSLELVACVLQLHGQFLHASVNCEDLHPKVTARIDSSRVVRQPLSMEMSVLVKANFGFGDVNACCILGSSN